MPPYKAIWWPRVVLIWDPLAWAHVLLSAIDHLEFSRVLCNRPSSFSHVTPKCHLTPPKPLSVPDAPTPVQASSGLDWYYCRSSWHLVSLYIRLIFGQMYPLPYPRPQVGSSSGQEQYYIRSTWHLVSIWIRLTCLFKCTSDASSQGNSSSMSGY